MNTIKVNWTPEPAHWRRPGGAHRKAAWSLGISAAILLALWLAGVATGVTLGGWIHLLLAAFAALLVICVIFGFTQVRYLEPMSVARDRILRWRSFRTHGHPHASLEELDREREKAAP